MTRYKELRKIIFEAEAEINISVEQWIYEAVQEAFDQAPLVNFVKWKQFVPSFNDGDPCYFRMGEIEVDYCEDDENWSELEERLETLTEEERKEYDRQSHLVWESVAQWDEDDMERVFGDGYTVTISRDPDTGKIKVDTDCYEHW